MQSDQLIGHRVVNYQSWKTTHLLCERHLCTGCLACFAACKGGAIEVVQDEKGFVFPEIHLNKCVDCLKCSSSCPVNSKIVKTSQEPYTIYAAWILDDEIKKESSSGGIFSALALSVLIAGGYVCGARYSSQMRVEHEIIDHVDKLYHIRGAKYSQSYIGDTYCKIEEKLRDSKTVLFCGTPCQVAGLYGYLKKTYQNLLTVELICQGVGSQLILDEYVKYINGKYSNKINHINFRYKNSYCSSLTNITFQNKKSMVVDGIDNSFRYGYGAKLFYRDCCYNCKYRKESRVGDLSLGDFWSVNEEDDDISDSHHDVSLVLINTENGEKYFNEIKNTLFFKEKEYKYAIEKSVNISSTLDKPSVRDDFFRDLISLPFRDVAKAYLVPPITLKSHLAKIGKLIMTDRIYRKVRKRVGR